VLVVMAQFRTRMPLALRGYNALAL
jgi:hypothetical protein